MTNSRRISHVPGIIDARARHRAAGRRLRNIGLGELDNWKTVLTEMWRSVPGWPWKPARSPVCLSQTMGSNLPGFEVWIPQRKTLSAQICANYNVYTIYNIRRALLKILSTVSKCGPGSSVSIVNDYGARRSGIESRWGRDFPPVQTGPGAHPASCTMGTGSFPGVKCGRGVLLTTHQPSSAAVMEQ